jgi:hypothetical protein
VARKNRVEREVNIERKRRTQVKRSEEESKESQEE